MSMTTPIIEGRDLPRHRACDRDVKHATFFKYMLMDVVTRYPGSGAAMLRCFDYFHQVYPLPVWDEAYQRAVAGCPASSGWLRDWARAGQE